MQEIIREDIESVINIFNEKDDNHNTLLYHIEKLTRKIEYIEEVSGTSRVKMILDDINRDMEIIKLEKQIQQVHRRLANIRKNYLHQTTTSIVKTKPYRIVIEDLVVSNMMKNRHLSNAISKQGFYEFRRQLEYKCKFRGIELIIADRFYPSSKICSKREVFVLY